LWRITFLHIFTMAHIRKSSERRRATLVESSWSHRWSNMETIKKSQVSYYIYMIYEYIWHLWHSSTAIFSF
jgi:hypothetical protein